MSDTRKHRKFTALQKTELVLASLRGPKAIIELCREQFLVAGAERLSGKAEGPRPTSSGGT